MNWKAKGFKSERQALRYLYEAIEKEFQKYIVFSNGKYCETFGELVVLWLKAWEPTVRQTTADYQKEILQRYLMRFIDERTPLKQITPLLIEGVWADILLIQTKREKDYLEQATLEKIRSLLKQILVYGYRHDLIQFELKKIELKIPADRKRKSLQRRKKKFLEKQEIQLLLEAINEKYENNQEINKMNKLYLDVVEFLIRNGLRIGELGALTIDKVDFTNCKLRIDEGLVAAGRTVKEYVRNPPKTLSSVREVDLDQRSIAIIQNRILVNQTRQKEMKQRQKGEYKKTYYSKEGYPSIRTIAASKKFIDSTTIFQTQNGTPVVYHSLNEFLNGQGNLSIQDIMKTKDPSFQKHLSSHTFRYTHISLLAEAGMPIKAIMERVGHANMKTTLEIYNQVSNTTKEKLIQEIDSWIF
ncbi:site-specific integrase [Enterococcus mundtii]|uniref:tyrosine-type recombinase/integrase n=1 Tax=Enterococcus mundtii TaxID=53346 RepID=UPI0030065D99